MDQDRIQKIQGRAHAIWEREGRPEGRHEEHWRQASEEIEREEDGSARPGTPPESPVSTGLTTGDGMSGIAGSLVPEVPGGERPNRDE